MIKDLFQNVVDRMMSINQINGDNGAKTKLLMQQSMMKDEYVFVPMNRANDWVKGFYMGNEKQKETKKEEKRKKEKKKERKKREPFFFFALFF